MLSESLDSDHPLVPEKSRQASFVQITQFFKLCSTQKHLTNTIRIFINQYINSKYSKKVKKHIIKPG